MTPDGHRAWAGICRDLAEREFAAPRPVTGAEMAWGAAVHAIKYIAHQRPNLPIYSNAHVRPAVDRLDAEYPGLWLSSDFGQAQELHRHFYRGHQTAAQIRNSWRLTQRLVANLLALTWGVWSNSPSFRRKPESTLAGSTTAAGDYDAGFRRAPE